MKFSRRAVTYPGQHTLHDGRTSDILHRLTFLGRASKNCSVVAMSVSPTPTVPIFLAWRSYNAIVSNIGKFVNLWCLISHNPLLSLGENKDLIMNTLTCHMLVH